MLERLRPAIRDLAGDLLFATGLTRPERAGTGALTVATFHRVLPEAKLREYPLSEIAVTPEELAWFVQIFQAHFTCGTLCDIYARWAAQEHPERPFLAITFDDGQLDNYLHARPVLDAAGVGASFFVPIEAIESNDTLWHDRLAYAAARWLVQDGPGARESFAKIGAESSGSDHEVVVFAVEAAKQLPPAERIRWVEAAEAAIEGPGRPAWDGMMSWEQLRSLVEGGHEVGSHSMTHSILPLVDDRQLDYEVRESKRVLEARLGAPVNTFCYPNGDCDRRVVEAVRRAGYRQAVTTAWGPNGPNARPLALRRCDIQGQHARTRNGRLSEARIAWRLSALHPGPKA